MDKSKKLYLKAIRYYNDGYLEKAMATCEKSISENINNTSAINLKGLLYYLKGELESAQGLWKMNYQMNKDLVSKKYLEDSQNDLERKALYNAALSFLKEIKIKEAMKLLTICKQSDFNIINVNNSIVLCCIKLGDYSKAEKAIEEVLNIDKSNKEALSYKKELIQFGILRKQKNIKKYAVVLSIIIAAIIMTIYFSTVNSKKLEADNNEQKQNIGNQVNNIKLASENNDKNTNNQHKNKTNKQANENFPEQELNKALQEANYEDMYNITSAWEGKFLKDEELKLLNKAKELLSHKGVEYFYNKGRESYAKKDFNKAVDCFYEAYSYGGGSYLFSHITYMLGASYKSTGDINNAIKYYSEYDNKYTDGDYEQTILYELTLIYRNIDNAKCKVYAQRLVKLYPKSIYNNSNIKVVLER